MNQYKLKISPAEAHIMRIRIKEIGLKVPEWFDRLTDAELASCYNGAGGDHTPIAIRKILTRLLGFAPETILIHDAEFQYTRRFFPLDYYCQKKFHTSNRRLGENAVILAKASAPWYSVLRYWRLFIARHARYVCDEWAYDEWIL